MFHVKRKTLTHTRNKEEFCVEFQSVYYVKWLHTLFSLDSLQQINTSHFCIPLLLYLCFVTFSSTFKQTVKCEISTCSAREKHIGIVSHPVSFSGLTFVLLQPLDDIILRHLFGPSMSSWTNSTFWTILTKVQECWADIKTWLLFFLLLEKGHEYGSRDNMNNWGFMSHLKNSLIWILKWVCCLVQMFIYSLIMGESQAELIYWF